MQGIEPCTSTLARRDRYLNCHPRVTRGALARYGDTRRPGFRCASTTLIVMLTTVEFSSNRPSRGEHAAEESNPVRAGLEPAALPVS